MSTKNFQGGHRYTEEGKPTHGYSMYLNHTVNRQDAERINLLSGNRPELSFTEAGAQLVKEYAEGVPGFHEAMGIIPMIFIYGTILLSVFLSLS